jgi:hypothetical protein
VIIKGKGSKLLLLWLKSCLFDANFDWNMVPDELRIKHVRDHLIIRIVFTAIFILFGAGLLMNEWNEMSKGPKLALVFIIGVPLVLFIDLLKELYLGKNEIILTRAGIELCGKGLFSWEMIDSFSTVESDDPYSESVILHFKEFADVKLSLYGLEKNMNEMIDLILAWKGSSSVYYAGHKKK